MANSLFRDFANLYRVANQFDVQGFVQVLAPGTRVYDSMDADSLMGRPGTPKP